MSAPYEWPHGEPRSFALGSQCIACSGSGIVRGCSSNPFGAGSIDQKYVPQVCGRCDGDGLRRALCIACKGARQSLVFRPARFFGLIAARYVLRDCRWCDGLGYLRDTHTDALREHQQRMREESAVLPVPESTTETTETTEVPRG